MFCGEKQARSKMLSLPLSLALRLRLPTNSHRGFGQVAFNPLSSLENPMNSPRRFLLCTALAIAASLGLSPALVHAQKDAGAKVRGEHSVPFWSSRSSARRISAASQYARDFQRYIAANPKPAPAVVKEVTTEIGNNLDEAKNHLAQLKKDFGTNKEAIAGIESIEKQLAAAFDQHKLLCECCEKEAFDKIATMECCNDLAQQLEKILDQHDALMLKLSPKETVAPRKAK
jgi:hypothetical protein